MEKLSPAWLMEREIIRMYEEQRRTTREIGKGVGASHQTILNILREAGVNTDRKNSKNWKARVHSEEIPRMYVGEDKPIAEISKALKLSAETVAISLRSQGIEIKRGGMRTIVFPELRKLKVGETLELPRVNPTTKQAYVRYYEMAKSAGIKVSVRVVSNDKVQVTRKA